MNSTIKAFLVTFLCSLFALTRSAQAQGTAFTYQGRLNSGTNLATGVYDLKFTLFTTNVTGTAVVPPVTNLAVAVNSGLFTVMIDFSNAFTGATNWLELAVRTNGATTFTNLTPRQLLTPVPYAIYASTVGNFTGPVSSAQIFGQLGSSALAGNYSLPVTFSSSGNSFSGNGSGLNSLTAANIVGSIASANLPTNVAYLNAGQTFSGNNTFSANVGIGTSPTSNPLEVQGNSETGGGVVEAIQNGGSIDGTAIAGYSMIPGGHGIIGNSDADLPGATGPGGAAIGVIGATFSTNGTAIEGFAGASSGVTYGVYGNTLSPQGYAGYFQGQSYFSANVGIGTLTPAKALDVAVAAGPVKSGTTSIDASLPLILRNTAANGTEALPNEAGIGFGQGSTRQAIMGGTFGDDFLDFFIGGNLTTPRMRIDHGGNVGIGTISPVTTLEVNGSATVDGTLNATTVTAGNFNAGTVASTNFSGNGSGLTNVVARNLKQIALLKWGPNLADNTFGVQFSPDAVCFDGTHVWVANRGSSMVMELDAATGATNGTYGVGTSPVAICFDGTSIWTANHDSKDVTKLNAASGATVGTSPIGFVVDSICFDGTNIWVGLDTLGAVEVINAGNGAVLTAHTVDTTGAGGSVSGLCFDGANIWAANSASNTVAKLNASTGAVIGNYPTGSHPAAVCFDGANIWVANEFGASVTKINGTTGAVIGTYNTGAGGGPFALCFDGSSIWVANASNNTVTKLNASTGATLATYPTGGTPQGICFDGVNIWTANNSGNSVSKL